MNGVRSWLCLLGGSLGLLGHALLDVVHGDGDEMGLGRGSTEHELGQTDLWVRLGVEIHNLVTGRPEDSGHQLSANSRVQDLMSVARQ